MALSLLLEEIRPGNWGEAQNPKVGVTAPLQAAVPLWEPSNPLSASPPDQGQSISYNTANLARLLPGLLKPLLTTQQETQPFLHVSAVLFAALG